MKIKTFILRHKIFSFAVVAGIILVIVIATLQDSPQQEPQKWLEQTAQVVENTDDSLWITVPYAKKNYAGALFHYRIDTGRIQEVSLPVADLTHVSATSDGDEIALIAHQQPDAGLFVYQPLRGVIRRLSVTELTSAFHSPVSSWIAYEQAGNIFAIHSENNKVVQLTNGDKTYRSPVISADGKTVAASYEDGDATGIELLSVNPETFTVENREIREGPDSTALSLSGDKQYIALSDEQRVINSSNSETVYTFPVETDVETVLGGATWLSDGTLIYTEWTGNFEEVNIHAVEPDFSAQKRYMIFAFTEPRAQFDATTMNSRVHITSTH